MPELPRRARVLQADPALAGLLQEWLAEAGCAVVGERDPADLILIDVPVIRWGGLDGLRRLAADNPGTPVLALSSSFLPGAGNGGSLASYLGVAAVLPKPVTREALLGVVQRLVGAPR